IEIVWVKSSKDRDSLGAQEDASKQGRSFEDIDKDAEVSLVDETQGRSDDAKMFETNDLHGEEVIVDMAVSEKKKQSVKVDEREVSTGVEDSVVPTIPVTTAGEGVTLKHKAVTSVLQQTTTKDQGYEWVVVQEPSEFRTTTSSPQASQPSKTKDKGKAIMIEPEVPLKKKDQVALNDEMARNLKAQLQAELIEEERLARKKLLAERLQSKKQEDDRLMRWKTIYSKKQKTDENEEVEVDNEAELKKHMVTVKDDDIAIDAIPLATKPPVIVEYKLIREGIMGHYQLIRADGSFKRYSSMIRMLQGIDREDLQTLWKLVKTKHGDTRPEDEHERVLWGDLKVMFEPDIKSDVWRNLQGYKVTVWKLFDSCGVHFVRFGNVHIFMLVEKRYPLTPITITNMLNKKLQADYWNEMCYQLLKLMFRGGLLGLKDFKMILRVTTAQLRNRSRIGINSMSWDNFKVLMREEFCPCNEMYKLETELWNHTIVAAGHAAFTDRFHELAKLVPHLVTPKNKRIKRYVYGLAPQIHGMVAATEPTMIQSVVLKAGMLTDEAIRN
ncbi:ribonuclease H-like domain-containing protein, partial [Tanacetum coccineum]